MSVIRVDRWLHLTSTPAFLLPVRANERGWRPLAAAAVMLPLIIVFGMVGFLVGGLIDSWLMDVLVIGRTPAWPADLSDLIGVGKASMDACQGCLIGGMSAMVIATTISVGCMIAVLIGAVIIYRRPAGSWITAAPRFRWRLFLAGLVLFGLPMAAAVSIPEALHGWPDRPVFLKADEAVSIRMAYVLVILLTVPLAAAFEEVLCRGWLMQVTAAFTHSLPAILLFNSLMFSLMHVDPDPGRNLSRAVLGMALSWAALRTNGLELGLGVHSANNLVYLLLVQTVQQPETSASSTTAGVTIALLVSLGAVAAVELVAHWPALREWSGFDLPAEATQAPAPDHRRNSTLAAP